MEGGRGGLKWVNRIYKEQGSEDVFQGLNRTAMAGSESKLNFINSLNSLGGFTKAWDTCESLNLDQVALLKRRT